MTCEVAVMNKRGIALAADSAVTLGSGPKIYHTAEKLFQLSPEVLVAIMTYGSTDITGVPWEVVVKTYRDKRRQQRFETLNEYANDFLNFIGSSMSLFPVERQEFCFRQRVSRYWTQYLDKLKSQLEEKNKGASTESQILERLIRADIKQWEENCPIIEELGSAYGNQVVEAHAKIIDELVKAIFGRIKVDNKLSEALRDTIRHMYTRQDFLDSNVVVAGMGDAEPFPSFFVYGIGDIAAGRLMCMQRGEDHVSDTDSATVAPFGQRQTIDMIMAGIHPHFEPKLFDNVGQLLPSSANSKKPSAGSGQIKENVQKGLHALVEERQNSFMWAVDALPRQDLARMADALVSLTAFLMQMAADQKETVGGPIDVALLSKGEGFVWIKRKSLGVVGI